MSFSLEDLEKIAATNKKILLLTGQNPSIDAISSLLAMSCFLQKIGIQTDILLPEGLPSTLNFLGKNFPIVNKLQYIRDFVLVFNTEKNPIAKVQTEKREREYLIRITPQKGTIHPKDFSFIPADFSYGWLMILGANGLGKIGQPYLENPDLFFEIPKINIDNQTENEKYGQINWLEETASTLGEMLARFFLEKQSAVIDQEIARLLLTAIISGTESFQTPNTSPHSMILAAQLMKYGVNQAEIVRHLYRNKNLSFLKIAIPVEWFPTLRDATDKQRNNWRFIGGGEGIHWDEMDEDILVEGLL